MNSIDNHKLMYHPHRVSDWLSGKKIYPIYAEVSLTSACNHRCRFCAPRFHLDYKPVFLDTEIIKSTIENMAACGVKAIMFGGEGEPLLHKDCVDIISFTKQCDIDVALTTNGVLFTDRIAQKLLHLLTWMKFSVDSGDVKVYSYLHGTKESDFKTVLDNISIASYISRIKKYQVKIGVQSLLFKDNIDSLYSLAKLLKYLKPSYFVVKPYSPHEKTKDDNLLFPSDEQIKKFLNHMEMYDDDYEFIYRETAFKNMNKEKDYELCYGKDFMAYINTIGDVYSCINYIGDKSFCYGNIYENSFENIWKNKKEILPDLNKCRTICRLDNMNRYLWELKHPLIDINFI